MQLVFVFPGQGSQSVGMLADLHRRHAEVRDCFIEASEQLGFDLWELVDQGPAERLNETEHTQPALLCASVAVWRTWLSLGGRRPDVVAGHSLGEFSALVAAGALAFGDAIQLVRDRGRFMQEAVPVGQGAMAAIMGLEDNLIDQVCALGVVGGGAGSVCEAVNFNSPGQVVIAGTAAAVSAAAESARQHGAKRAVMLPVSAPFHSSLMHGAAERFATPMGKLPIAVPSLRFVSSVDSNAYSDPEAIRALLVRQLASPVHWTKTVRMLSLEQPTMFVECGPGKVLTGLNRRAEKRTDCAYLAIEDGPSVEAALGAAAASCVGR